MSLVDAQVGTAVVGLRSAPFHYFFLEEKAHWYSWKPCVGLYSVSLCIILSYSLKSIALLLLVGFFFMWDADGIILGNSLP